MRDSQAPIHTSIKTYKSTIKAVRINNKVSRPMMALTGIYVTLIKKTYHFINVVNGVGHSHKTANIFCSFDSLA